MYIKKGRPVKKDYKEIGSQIHAYRQEGKTLKEIGIIFGVTRERIRQLYNLYKERNPYLRLPVKAERKEVTCDICGSKTIRSTNRAFFYRKIKCQNCFNRDAYRKSHKKTTSVHFARHERSKYCLVCQKPFILEFKYFISNRCKKCFNVEKIKQTTGDRRRAEWLSYFYRGEEYPHSERVSNGRTKF